ncbi:MAG: YceI family protein [Crocinitomicaceae bacterium]|nr:YceI family protein [Crocinitomicaceae bacterium]
MKKGIIWLCALAFMTLSAFTSSTLLSWKIKEDYSIKFEGIAVEGTLQGLEGTVVFDKDNLSASKFDVSVKTQTIDTGNKTQTKHAKNKKWFNVEQYPSISFQSSNFQQTAEGYAVTGQLTIKDVTKEVTIPFTFQDAADGGIFEGSFKVNRKDYNIKGNGFGFVVSNEISIDLRIPVNQ